MIMAWLNFNDSKFLHYIAWILLKQNFENTILGTALNGGCSFIARVRNNWKLNVESSYLTNLLHSAVQPWLIKSFDCVELFDLRSNISAMVGIVKGHWRRSLNWRRHHSRLWLHIIKIYIASHLWWPSSFSRESRFKWRRLLYLRGFK